jgi:hypothetical protein
VSPQFVDPFRIYAGTCTVGPRNGDVIFRCWNLGFNSGCTANGAVSDARNYPTQPIFWQDQFACQVIRTSPLANGSVWVRIRRLDAPGGGWGQNPPGLPAGYLEVPRDEPEYQGFRTTLTSSNRRPAKFCSLRPSVKNRIVSRVPTASSKGRPWPTTTSLTDTA